VYTSEITPAFFLLFLFGEFDIVVKALPQLPPAKILIFANQVRLCSN